MVKKKNHVEFMHEMKVQNPEITVLGTYQNCITRIAVKCNTCGWEWSPLASNLLRGHGCPKCGGTMQKTHAKFVADLKSQRDDVIIIGPYVKALQKTKFRFLTCGHEWDITPAHILSGRGCPVCGHSRRGASQRLTMEIFLERLHKIDPNLVVRKGVMYRNNHTLMPLRCKVCGYTYKISAHAALISRGCPNCHRACTSFFEQFIYHAFAHVLGNSKVISRDKTAIGVELDVYIPELNAAIEPGSWYWHKNLVARDRKKHLLCTEKGIRLITIYDHYDEIRVPFDNCLVTPYDLTSIRNTDKLIEITKNVLSEFGLDPNLDKGEWKEIKRKAQMDSRRITTEEFKEELSTINSKIEIVGEYTKANDKIKARCKICNHEWYVAPTTLRRGSGCAKCAGKLKITHNQFVERLKLLQPHIVPLTEYVNSKTRVKFSCKKCGYIWCTLPYHLITKSKRTSCPRCSHEGRKTHDRSRKVRCITTGEIFNTLREAAAKYNIHSTSICQCCNNHPHHKRAGGQEWEYIEMLSEASQQNVTRTNTTASESLRTSPREENQKVTLLP